MADETPTPETPQSSPLADALIDFNTLGGGSSEPTTPTETVVDDADDFLKAFNEEVKPEPAATADPKPEPATDPKPDSVETKDDIDEIPEPEKASAAAKENFAKIKESAKGYKAKLEAAEALIAAERAEKEAEITKLREQLASVPELSEKAKFAEEAEKELSIARVEGTAEFKRTITEPLAAIERRAIEIAKTSEVDADALIDALVESDPTKQEEMLNALIANMTPLAQARVTRMAEDTQDLLRKREEIRSRASEARKEQEAITAANAEKAQKEARKKFETAAESTVGELKKRVPFIPLLEGETADGVFAGILAKAKAVDFDSAPVENRAFAAASAVLMPRLAKQNLKLQEENKLLLARIAENNASRGTVAEPEKPAPTDGGDFFDNLGIQTGNPLAKLK